MKIIALPAVESFPLLLAFNTVSKLNSKKLDEFLALKNSTDRLFLICRQNSVNDIRILRQIYADEDLKAEFCITDLNLAIFEFAKAGKPEKRKFKPLSDFLPKLADYETRELAVFADCLSDFDLAFLKKLDAMSFKLFFATSDFELSRGPLAKFESYLNDKPNQLELF